jgi:hypothetical protein
VNIKRKERSSNKKEGKLKRKTDKINEKQS